MVVEWRGRVLGRWYLYKRWNLGVGANIKAVLSTLYRSPYQVARLGATSSSPKHACSGTPSRPFPEPAFAKNRPVFYWHSLISGYALVTFRNGNVSLLTSLAMLPYT